MFGVRMCWKMFGIVMRILTIKERYEPASPQSAIAFLPILNSFRSFLNAYLASRYVAAAPVRAAAATKGFILISFAFGCSFLRYARLFLALFTVSLFVCP